MMSVGTRCASPAGVDGPEPEMRIQPVESLDSGPPSWTVVPLEMRKVSVWPTEELAFGDAVSTWIVIEPSVSLAGTYPESEPCSEYCCVGAGTGGTGPAACAV